MESQETVTISENIGVGRIEINKISVTKFIILTVVTLGLYEIWWIYKSWCFFGDKERSDIMPALRTVFSIIFLIPLFNKILKLAKGNGYKHDYVSAFLFVGYVIASFIAMLPDPFWLLTLFSFIFLIPPFKALNYAMDYCPEFRITEQESFSGRQIFLLIAGGICWITGLILLFMGKL